jgi:tetratricopeptide (TPR) repeat protein
MFIATETVSKRRVLMITLGLLVITAAAYFSVGNHDFINFDDDIYVTDNQTVRRGLTLNGIRWAFGFNQSGYWHPVTWISHMMDCELHGLNPAGHHWTSLMIHLANAVLLFWVWLRMTGDAFRSALVAVLFALHPLNVDSVAWVSERKNVLSTFFWMLCLVLYHRYTLNSSPFRYLLTLIVYTLGLMTKPMLVTLPYIFLLLDFWPLERLKIGKKHRAISQPPKGITVQHQPVSTLKLAAEKLPFIGISFASIWLSVSSLQHIHNMHTGDSVPLALRVSNAIVSYASYIGKMIWPVDLAIYYPYPTSIPLWRVAAAAALLTAVTGLCLYGLKRKPYLTVGWLWYLGSLVPVIGLVQGGLWPQMADRWAYVPLVGLFVMIAWSLPDRLPKLPLVRPTAAIVAIALIGVLFGLTRSQVQHWRNSQTLFRHALEVTASNPVVLNNLGNALLSDGRVNEALVQLQAALNIDPDHSGAHNNLGNALMKLGRTGEAIDHGRTGEAIDHYQKSIKLNPIDARTRNNLAVALHEQGRWDESIRQLRTALSIRPEYADAYSNLGAAYRQKGEIKKAAKSYLRAIQINPRFSQAYNNLGLLLWQKGQLSPSIDYFRQALNKDPEFIAARDNLRKALAARDNYRNAVHQLQEDLDQVPDDAELYLKLGDLYKRNGKLKKALAQYQQALGIRPNHFQAQYNSAVIYAMQGHYEKALGLLKRLVTIQPDHIDVYYYIAGIYSRRNDVRNSIHWLKKAIDRGYNNWERIKSDRNFDNISGTSDFKRLVGMR